MYKLFILLCCALILNQVAEAQVVTVSPLFPDQASRNSQITITYDAGQGNGALLDSEPIYAHTGLITTQSPGDTGWLYVNDVWGTQDNEFVMTAIGNNKFTLTFTINSLYGDDADDTILYMAFVFRNVYGTAVGRNADGSNILVPMFVNDSLNVAFFSPLQGTVIVPLDSSINNILAIANRSSNLTLTENGNLLQQATGDSISYGTFHFLNYGNYEFQVTAASQGDTLSAAFNVLVNPPLALQDPPANVDEGINYINDSTVVLELVAPYKNSVYVIGDFNNWQVDTNYLMHLASDGQTFWIQISHLVPQKQYVFQYLVDGYIRIGDPYSEQVSDPNVDLNIPPTVYPNLIQYPYGKTTNIASVLQTAQPAYPWQINNFQKPDKSSLTIYELLVRDFAITQSYSEVTDSLDYLSNLGVTAIELMPVMNFESNSSWGYNTNYFCAPEKTYGPKDSLKSFIDACHSRGIAVLLDIPFNDAFGSNPMVMMYWDSIYQVPTLNNPWFNQYAPHPYSVGYDFNHLSNYTRTFVKNVTRFWLSQYHADGFRFDLTKGYTQTYSGNNVELWGEYDASRIAILEDMVDSIWAFDPSAFVVFEHLSENPEETVLADYGIMQWGDLNTQYSQATMGYPSGASGTWDFSSGSYEYNGWDQPNEVTYMESHDEERVMYNNETYGDSVAGYDIKPPDTGTQRMELAGTLFFTIPGPKMIWQFGEMGYDVSINEGCRICNKPILWNYLTVPYRVHMWKVWKALIALRKTYPTFQTTNYTTNFSGTIKTIQLTYPGMDAVAAGNFDVGPDQATPGFQHTGMWYDYFTGDSINVTGTGQTMNYAQGEYHLYTDVQLPLPDLSTTYYVTGIQQVEAGNSNSNSAVLYPNPSGGNFTLTFSMPVTGLATLEIYDISGKLIYTLRQNLSAGEQNIRANVNTGDGQVASGIYFYRLLAGQTVYNGKISVINN
jgi:glycosidase